MKQVVSLHIFVLAMTAYKL